MGRLIPSKTSSEASVENSSPDQSLGTAWIARVYSAGTSIVAVRKGFLGGVPTSLESLQSHIRGIRSGHISFPVKGHAMDKYTLTPEEQELPGLGRLLDFNAGAVTKCRDGLTQIVECFAPKAVVHGSRRRGYVHVGS